MEQTVKNRHGFGDDLCCQMPTQHIAFMNMPPLRRCRLPESSNWFSLAEVRTPEVDRWNFDDILAWRKSPGYSFAKRVYSMSPIGRNELGSSPSIWHSLL